MENEKKTADVIKAAAEKAAEETEKKVKEAKALEAAVKEEIKTEAEAEKDKAKAEISEVKKTVKGRAKKAMKKVRNVASAKDATKAAVSRTNEEIKAAREEAKKSRDEINVKSEVHLQFSGKSYATEDLVKIAKDVWQYDHGNDPKDIKTIELYVKPAENLTYYVINENVTGSFFI